MNDMKTIKDIAVSNPTPWGDLAQAIDENFNELYLNAPNYCVGYWDKDSLNPESLDTLGDVSLLKKWDFYLLDTTDNANKTTLPVGKLKRNNLLRFEDGSFAPTVGITEDMRAECDVASFGSSLSRKFRDNPLDSEVKEHDDFIKWVKEELTKIGF